MSSEMIPFSFESSSVRVFADDAGEPWFCGPDVCDVLGYANSRDAISKHCREKGVAKRDTLTEGGIQALSFISEGNLYRLIIKSRKPEAEMFESWVCDQVLPTIRKTGRYTVPHPRPDRTRKALPGGLTIEQQDAVKALIKSRVEILPHDRQAKAAITCWSSIKSKFGVSYKAVPAEQFTEVLSLVARLPLEGELLKADDPCHNPPLLPLLEGKMGERFLIRLDDGGRYSVIPLGITEIVIDLSDLVAIDQAMDTWRDFAKRKELRYYRAGMANLQSNGH